MLMWWCKDLKERSTKRNRRGNRVNQLEPCTSSRALIIPRCLTLCYALHELVQRTVWKGWRNSNDLASCAKITLMLIQGANPEGYWLLVLTLMIKRTDLDL